MNILTWSGININGNKLLFLFLTFWLNTNGHTLVCLVSSLDTNLVRRVTVLLCV